MHGFEYFSGTTLSNLQGKIFDCNKVFKRKHDGSSLNYISSNTNS